MSSKTEIEGMEQYLNELTSYKEYRNVTIKPVEHKKKSLLHRVFNLVGLELHIEGWDN